MVAVVDYGMGNLRSVQKAFERIGAEAEITSDPRAVIAADRLVLPGVGAFGDAMEGLRQRDLIEPILSFLESGKPFLGICLGLQLLFDESDEGSEPCPGLGVIPGRVARFEDSPDFKVPHMGWNQVIAQKQSPLLEGVDDGSWFYFVHSYYVIATRQDDVLLETDYTSNFCSAIAHGSIFATQFHPEKSQHGGLRLLKNFATFSQR